MTKLIVPKVVACAKLSGKEVPHESKRVLLWELVDDTIFSIAVTEIQAFQLLTPHLSKGVNTASEVT